MADPTRAELIEGLAAARRRVAELEASVAQARADAEEHRRANNELRRCEKWHQEIVERLREGIYTTKRGIFTSANRAMCKIFGYEEDELIGMPSWDIAAPELRESTRTRFFEMVESGALHPIEVACQRRDGSLVTAEVRISSVKDDGEVQGLVLDITDRKRTEEELEGHRSNLETMVRERTQELLEETIERKRAEETLREEEEKFRVISDQALMGIIVLQDEQFIYVNAHAAAIMEVPAEKIAHWSPGDYARLIHPDDLAFVMEQGRKKQAGEPGATVHYSWRMVTPAGNVKWIEMWSKSVSLGGRLADMVTMIDITERTRAEQALRESEKRLGLIADTIGDVFWIVEGSNHATVFASSAYETVWGKSVQQLYENPTDWADAIHPDDRQKAWEAFVGLEEGDGFDEEYRITASDGSLKWIRDRGYPIRDADGLLTQVVGIASDITERKLAAEALRQNEILLNAIIENIPHMIFLKDAKDLRFVRFNTAGERLLGYSRDEMVGKCDYDLFPADEADFFTSKDRAALDGGAMLDVPEERVDTRLHGTKILHTKKVPLMDGVGRPTYLLGISEDITERKRAEEERRDLQRQVQQAQKMESLGILAGGIAHDFNNILTGLLVNAELALEDLPPDSTIRPLLLDVVKAGRRAAELTGEMLAYSGKGAFEMVDIDISALVRDMASLLESATSKKAGLSYELSAELPAVTADATQLAQIVLNLVVNGSEAVGEQGGQVAVRTYTVDCESVCLEGASVGSELAEGPYVIIEVTDTGCGMDEETRAKIFDPFFTTKFTGRGLGLAAVQGIVRGHKGALLVESEQGKGTTFKVLLPALDRPAVPVDERSTEEAGWHRTGTILVVDDEEMLRRVAVRVLSRIGFAVLTASDGVEAINIFRERHDEIACVLLDLNMPRMGGEDTFEELRRIRRDVPVILLSGYDEQQSTQRFCAEGLAGFLQKPYEVAGLLDKLREVLGD